MRVGANQVAPPQLDPVEAVGRGREVDQPLDHEHRLRPAGAAIGVGRRRVAQDGARAKARRRNAVDARSITDTPLMSGTNDTVCAPTLLMMRAAQREKPALASSASSA